MLIDDLREQLKTIDPNIQTILSFWKNSQLEAQFQKYEKLSQEENFWKNPQKKEISKDLQNIKALRDQYNDITITYSDIKELLDLFAHNETELQKISPDLGILQKKVDSFKINLLLNEPHDSSSCVLHTHAGAGGTESQDWANMLLRMYARFCERTHLAVDVLDYQPGEEAGIKSATLFIRGKNPYGLLK